MERCTHSQRPQYFQEWFDHREDCSAHCTISLEHWQRLLRGGGFNCMTFSSSHLQEDHSLMFLAQKASADHCVLPPMVKRLASPCHPHGNGNAKTCYALEIFASKDLSRLHLHKELLMHISAPIFSYSRGREMRLWDQLAALDMAEALLIWIVATNGPDGDVARGLCRTLAKELPAWKIHLVICEARGSGELGHTKGAREGCAVAWEAWRGPGCAKGGQDAWVARRCGGHAAWFGVRERHGWGPGCVGEGRDTSAGAVMCWWQP